LNSFIKNRLTAKSEVYKSLSKHRKLSLKTKFDTQTRVTCFKTVKRTPWTL